MFFLFDIEYERRILEIIINGVRYTKKSVAPPKSKPVPVATSDGVINIGNVFLKPYLNVEYTIKKLIILPTNS